MLATHAKEIKKLRRIIVLAKKLIDESPKPRRRRPARWNGKDPRKKRANGKHIRRTGKILVQFRKMLKAERKRGLSVADLARKHGISSAYIYML